MPRDKRNDVAQRPPIRVVEWWPVALAHARRPGGSATTVAAAGCATPHSETQVGVVCAVGSATGSPPWLAQGPFRCSQHRTARLFHQLYHLCRRLLAGDNGEDVISPPRQRPALFGDVLSLVVDAGGAGLMADVGEHPFDDMRLNSELVMHGGTGEPPKVVQHPVGTRTPDSRIERLAPRGPPLEAATAPEHVIAGPWSAAKDL